MILGIEGSPRKEGNSHLILDAVLDGARAAGGESRAVHLREVDFAACTGCESCRRDKACTGFSDGMTAVYPLLEKARGLVLATPVHNYNVSARIKAFIDRLYCYYDFGDARPRPWSSRLAGQGRKAVIAAVAEQESRADMGVAMEAMRLPLAALGYEIVAEVEVLGVFDRGAVAQRPEVLALAAQAGRDLARSLGF